MQDDSDVYRLPCSDEQCCVFSLGGGSHDVFDDVSNVEYCAVVGRDVSIGREKKMAACPAACFGLAEVTCVAVGGEDHVAGVVGEDGVFLCC